MIRDLEELQIKVSDINVYCAGIPDFKSNFTRDSLISGILLRDTDLLKNQLLLCSKLQGKKIDPFNGEEPGKIFHEYPKVIWNGLSTEYNACDTTALFIIAHDFYLKYTGEKDLFIEQKKNILAAVDYILSHLNNYFFEDSPKYINSERFALPITYWKDSWIPNRKNFEPIYPVTYTLAHVENMIALKIASELLCIKTLKKTSNRMKRKLKRLFHKKKGFCFVKDKKGFIYGANSDFLQMLFFLEKGTISNRMLKFILKQSKKLETPAGYRTQDPNLDKQKKDFYVNNICPFEQALINQGAKKFNLDSIAKVTTRIINYLDTNPELLIIKSGAIKKKGCDPQLWTIAAKFHFNSFNDSKHI